MVHFSGLLQLRLFNGLCPVVGTVRGLVSELSSELFYNTPKYIIVVFNVFRVFYRHNLNFS